MNLNKFELQGYEVVTKFFSLCNLTKALTVKKCSFKGYRLQKIILFTWDL